MPTDAEILNKAERVCRSCRTHEHRMCEFRFIQICLRRVHGISPHAKLITMMQFKEMQGDC